VYLRPPDTSGIDYWVGRMEGGMAETQIAAFFASSREFLTRYGRLSDAAFVDRMYTNVLGRPPDAPGRAYWIDQLRRGMSRGKVVLLFAFSGEYRRQQTAAVDVVNLYLGLLRRAPTSVERTAGLAAPSITTLATSIQ